MFSIQKLSPCDSFLMAFSYHFFCRFEYRGPLKSKPDAGGPGLEPGAGAGRGKCENEEDGFAYQGNLSIE